MLCTPEDIHIENESLRLIVVVLSLCYKCLVAATIFFFRIQFTFFDAGLKVVIHTCQVQVNEQQYYLNLMKMIKPCVIEPQV